MARNTAPIPDVRGLDLDDATRCAHYHSPLDIVAIKTKCCGVYYACKDCHVELADHPIAVWPRADREQPAILCGGCKGQLTIGEYLECGSHCPKCGRAFNPGCQNHYHFYFEM